MMRRSLYTYTRCYYRLKNMVSSSNCIAVSSYGLNTRFFTSSPPYPFQAFYPFGEGENPHIDYIDYKVKEAKAESDSGLPIPAVNCTREEKAVEEEEVTSIKKGDVINISDLIFTKNRDYLIKCNDGQQVKSEQLAGKVVVIYFDSVLKMDQTQITYLMDIYNDLQPNNGFEVIFVDVNDVDDSFSGEVSLTLSCQGESQTNLFYCMPWTAIPLSDITSRKHLKQRFGLPKVLKRAYSFVIDQTGAVLQCDSCGILQYFGALGYPFSDERINYLKFEDNETAKHPSLKALLASPQRDYLITNKGDEVLIHTLEDKVVALFFYEEGFTDENITLELKSAYEELAKNNKKFEVVLIYIYDGANSYNFTNEDSFWKTFKAMPWLALPFRDSILKKLERIFVYPFVFDEPGYALIILGPHMEFIEPFGLFILREFKIPAFPFSREKIAKLISAEANELKLEMLWDQESVFGEKYEFQVQYSQLAGKRVIIIHERFLLKGYDAKFLEFLKEKYNQMKGTADEFEVIHITQESFGNKIEACQVANLPWFVQPAGACRGFASNFFNFYERHTFYYDSCSLIAFGQDGRVVRRTIHPHFPVPDANFPFYAGGLEKEALLQVVYAFSLDSLHYNIYLYNIEIDPAFKPCIPGPLVPCVGTSREM